MISCRTVPGSKGKAKYICIEIEKRPGEWREVRIAVAWYFRIVYCHTYHDDENKLVQTWKVWASRKARSVEGGKDKFYNEITYK